MNKASSHGKIQRMTGMSIFIAIIVVLTILCTFVRFGPFSITLALAPIIIGIALAILTVSALTKNLKSVKQKQSAADYEVPGSLRLTRNEDYFMYRNVSKTAKPRESSSGSSGTHTSSSGNSHSGGGRSF